MQKVQWVFQSSGLPMFHYEALLEAAKQAKDCITHNIGLVPFSHEITGLELIDLSLPTFIFGSTTLIELASKGLTPFRKEEIFYHPDILTIRGKYRRDDFLNELSGPINLGNLRKNEYIFGVPLEFPLFVKPMDEIKGFKGTVLTKDNITEFLEGQEEKPDDYKIWGCDYIDIWAEWRFFIVNGEVVTGSSYHIGGISLPKRASNDLLKIAQAKATEWLPLPTCTMDLALLGNGDIKVVEFNAIQSSGLYDSDPKAIVNAINELMRDNYDNKN